jgi:aminoglycoside/choline kinase family phosphotransferase
MGVIGTDKEENSSFIYLAGHFKARGINVPDVYGVSEDGMAYIQEDLGSVMLLDCYAKARQTGEGIDQAEALLCRTMAMLPKIQFEGARNLDFNVCHPQKEFGYRTVMFDLNYFKYCFLKATGLEFHEMLLQDDFERLCEDLCSDHKEHDTFLYRDFQARNVMVRDGEPYFIDFQGGRRGPMYYDVASFIWHARAGYDDALKEKMLESYLDALSIYIKVDRSGFMQGLRLFRLFRYLQVLGAYGFRGWTEHKANFVTSIPAALNALAELIREPFERYPYLMEVLRQMLDLPRFAPSDAGKGGLEVTVYSFSFKKGVPYDPSGNGGGYVFDCRSIHNPGRYEPYKKLTGRDEPVIKFLEDDGEVFAFLDHVYGVVDPHVETYAGRGFTNLMVSFGCTGGQHRSVYCAEHLAAHLAAKYPDITVRLIHREQNISMVL